MISPCVSPRLFYRVGNVASTIPSGALILGNLTLNSFRTTSRGVKVADKGQRLHLFPPSEHNTVVYGKLDSDRQPVKLQVGEGVRVPVGSRDK